MKTSGALTVVDYNTPSIVDDLARAVRKADGNFVGIIDCISAEDHSLPHCIAVLEKLGGGKLGVVKPHLQLDMPANIELCKIFGLSDLTDEFWRNYLTPALDNGTLKCLPAPRIVGEGLGCLQEAMDSLKKGVSATKLVVALEN